MTQFIRFLVVALVLILITVFGCDNKSTGSNDKPPEPFKSYGSIEILSVPSGATIIFNNDTISTTPDTLTNILAGYYSLKLIMNGHSDYSSTVRIDSAQMASINGTLRTGQIIGNLSQPPEIDFINLSSGDSKIYGVANNIDASKIRVVLWALTNKWYVQPWIYSPWTEICDDGSWNNSTHGWKSMVAVLVDSTYIPGSVRYTHPGFEQGVFAFSQYPSVRSDLPIEFSGHTWGVKQSADKFDPGPNYWSATVDNIWIDTAGLHLQIVNDGGKWTCPEVYLLQSHGYGTYTFELGSQVDNLDPRSVLGCFTYESTSRELDIEFSKALASPNNAQFVTQPYNHSGNIYRFDMPAITYSTHQIEWKPGYVIFRSWRGIGINPDSLITSWNYTGNDIPPENIERWRFNLWLFGGNPPSTGIGDHIIIRSFDYQP